MDSEFGCKCVAAELPRKQLDAPVTTAIFPSSSSPSELGGVKGKGEGERV
ncbi:hypothetical protein [Nostoc sp. FACHB-133]|nr:hypothetical protein [Nostoc sp. FACHB-133]MBD2527722.1 hypothetical protein [Nostoc sp. FACHB-133]